MERDELRPVIPAHAGIHLLCAFVDSGHRTQVANLRYCSEFTWAGRD